jgi:PPOX class probable F420-dependent enzyme
VSVSPEEARDRFAAQRRAILCTTDPAGQPHAVPVTFAVDGDTVFSAVDHKPKSTLRLKRLANIVANPRVCLLADRYEDDWTQLWWARADGTARVLEDPATAEAVVAIDALRGRYGQYRDRPPEGPVVVVAVERWSGWAAS